LRALDVGAAGHVECEEQAVKSPSWLHRYARWQERWRDPMLTALLLLLVLEIFIGLPLMRTEYLDARVFALVWLFMIISAVAVAARHWLAIAAMLLSSIVALVVNLLRFSDPTPSMVCVGSASVMVFMATLIWIVGHAVFGPGRVTTHRIRGAIVLYLCIALFFASLYEVFLALNPAAITGAAVHGKYLLIGQGLVYYSFTTLTSTGYGDLIPVEPLVRSLSNLESVIGQLYPATLLARIVSLELHRRQSET
jgi:D-alanyl-lipoteichoic acid acyltransferase DltB (MBOAT superfamily)